MPPFDHDAYHAARRTSRLGAVVHFVERTTSTMDLAREGRGGRSSCGAVYVAGQQTAGRGRLGRSWVSAAATGVYATFHLCPRHTQGAHLLSVAGALAAAEAVEQTGGIAVQLKWPNDVLHDGRKLCGVLAEAHARDTGALDVFLGIGINLHAPPSLPPEVAALATSIGDAGGTVPARETLLAALATALERRAEQAERRPDALLADWRARLVTLGERVCLVAPGGEVEGDAVDVTPRGELVLRLDDGSTRTFSAGDVTTARAQGAG